LDGGVNLLGPKLSGHLILKESEGGFIFPVKLRPLLLQGSGGVALT